MSVMQMRKISLVGQAKDAQILMTTLQNFGLVHISSLPPNAMDLVDEKELSHLSEFLMKLHRAIDGIKNHEASSLVIPPKCANAQEALPEVLGLLDEIESSKKSMSQLCDDITEFQMFGEFAEDLSPLSKVNVSLKLAHLTDAELAQLQKISQSYEVVKKTADVNHVAIFLQGDEKLPFNMFDPPGESLLKKTQQLAALKMRCEELSSQCSRWYYQLRSFEKLEQETRDAYDRMVELKKARSDDDLFGISGFVLKENVEALKRALLHHLVALRIEEPHPNAPVPVKLDNPKVIRGFEAILRAFSGVNYFEKDKTKIIALLFVIFGSLCFIDSGYGLLLMILGYVVAIKKHKSFGQVFMWTGVVTTILGVLCGQFFGLVFGKDILPTIPPLLTLATDAMVCFKFSIFIGILVMALTNAVVIYERGLATNATGNFLAICAGLLLVANRNGLFVGQIDDYTFLVNNLCIALFCTAIMAWLIFPDEVFGKQSRISNILWTLYSGPVGLIQDILSHMRLFGIALSGAILALVVNKVGGLMPFLASVFFVPIGHFFVFLLSLLSLYIHTNRLIFLEFGSKCMIGGADYFMPFCRRLSDEKNY